MVSPPAKGTPAVYSVPNDTRIANEPTCHGRAGPLIVMAIRRLTLTLLCLPPLVAQRALLEELPGDAEARSALAVPEFGPELESIELPGKGLPHGIARVGDRLWLARGDELLCVSWPERTLLQQVPAPGELVGLATDGKQLFAATKDRVFVLDKLAGRPVREVALDIGPWIGAIAHFRGALHVAADRRLRRVVLDTGKTEIVADVPDLLHWLATEGEVLHGGHRHGAAVLLRGQAVPTWTGTTWPLPLAASAATWVDGRLLLLAVADPQDGGRVIAGRIDVTRCLPIERLPLELHRGDAAGELIWLLGPKPLPTAAALERELGRVAKDPAATLRFPDGSRRLMPVVLQPYPGVTIAELRATWDRVVAAGFEWVVAPEQEAWGRLVRQQRLAEEKDRQKAGKE